MNKIKVLFVPSDSAGVGHYRSIWPAQEIQRKYGDDFFVEINMDYVSDINYYKQFDIIHFHRQLGPYESMNNLISELRNSGVVVIMDIDDYWVPPITHPLYLAAIKDKLPEKITTSFKMVDYVTTTTNIFSKHIQKYNTNTFVIPNAIDMNHRMWKDVDTKKSDKLRVTWIGGSCLKFDMEILTDQGFKFVKDLNKTEKVACLNPRTNELEFNKPSNYIKVPYNGMLNCGNNNLIEFAVTPNHNMFVSVADSLTQKNTKFKLQTSESVYGKDMHFKKDAIWKGTKCNDFILPGYYKILPNIQKEVDVFIDNNCHLIDSNAEIAKSLQLVEGIVGTAKVNDKQSVVSIRKSTKGMYYLLDSESVMKTDVDYTMPRNLNMNLWLKFFGFWIAEGWISTTEGLHQVGVAQVKNNGYLKEIFDTLVELGFKPTYTKDLFQIRVFDKQLWNYLSQFGKAENKFVPREILDLCPEQLNIFLDWYLKGDGSQEKSGKRFDNRLTKEGNVRGEVIVNTSRKRGYTVSKKLADNIQEICLKLGVISTIINRGKRNSTMRDGRKVIAKHDAYVISIGADSIRSRKTPLLRSKDQYQEFYNDYVYCVEVPDNIIYVRKNGKTFWIGNSHKSDLEILTPSMNILHNDEKLHDKYQIVMCGYDTRGFMTEIGPDGQQVSSRKILPSETVWNDFEKIFTNDYNPKLISSDYKKYLEKHSNEEYKNDDVYKGSYIRRWTLPLTRYGEHYNYCDVCMAPLAENIFNEVKSELKIIEAGLKKKVLIAQDYSVYKELLTNDVNGILISKKNNERGWYEAIKKLINNPDKVKELSENLYKFVSERYTLEVVTKNRVEFYRDVISKKQTSTQVLNTELTSS